MRAERYTTEPQECNEPSFQIGKYKLVLKKFNLEK